MFAIGILFFIKFFSISVLSENKEIFLFFIASPFVFFLSFPIFKVAFISLKHCSLNMDVMYSMGIFVAYLSSVLGTFSLFLSKEFIFYDTAIMLPTFLMFGKFLEEKAKGKTSQAIQKLIKLQPKMAFVERDGKEMEISVEDLIVGDIVFVKPGEKIPVDGKIVEGLSYIDESMITGEFNYVHKKPGDSIFAGTINKNNVLKFKAEKIGKDTFLSQIIQLVEKAQTTKPSIQKLADSVVSYFIPVILLISISVFFTWYFVFDETLLFALRAFISILVVACPCALGLATPTAVTVGLGLSADFGILIKNINSLEITKKLTVVVFDKTGTITKGKPEVVDIIPFNFSTSKILEIAASVEKNSNHPIAHSIVQKAEEKECFLKNTSAFFNVSGKGVSANIEGKEALVGNKRFLYEKNIQFDKSVEKTIESLELEAKTVSLVAYDDVLGGIIAVSDPIRKNSKKTIDILNNMKIKTVMITGDNKKTAEAVALKTGISQVIAQTLPEDKLNAIKKIQAQGDVVAFVGDGINDAPALTQANIGFAMGKGTDVAIESGDVVLMRDDILDVIAFFQIAKKVMNKIKQNLFWAFFYNILLIPLAAGLLFPLFKISFKPEWAGFAMAMSSVSVVSFSLLMKNFIPPIKKES